jgi:hypothetical protein
MEDITNNQAKVRLQAKSSRSKSTKTQPTPLAPALPTSTSHEGTYAEIASHPADPSAPVITHNPVLDTEKQQIPLVSGGVEGAQDGDGGAIELLTRVYREKGLGGWYKGLGAQIVKAVLCQGMSLLCYSILFYSISIPIFYSFLPPVSHSHSAPLFLRQGKEKSNADIQVSCSSRKINSNHIPSSS